MSFHERFHFLQVNIEARVAMRKQIRMELWFLKMQMNAMYGKIGVRGANRIDVKMFNDIRLKMQQLRALK